MSEVGRGMRAEQGGDRAKPQFWKFGRGLGLLPQGRWEPWRAVGRGDGEVPDSGVHRAGGCREDCGEPRREPGDQGGGNCPGAEKQ